MTDQRTIDDLLDPGTTVSLVTSDLRARPMTVQDVSGADVWFFTDRDADWVTGLTDGDEVGLTLADKDDGMWASLVGTATRVDDQGTKEELFGVVDQAWFDGADDPKLLALRVTVTDGEWWDAPGSTIARVVALGAALVSDDAEAGGQGDVAV